MALPFISHLLLLYFVSTHVLTKANTVLEEGYTVTTVIDGNKLGLYPHAIVSQYGSSDLLLLDSVHSSFYALSFPLSLETAMKQVSGGEVGYVDGELSSAKFFKPRSFAVDAKGNVYVADERNHVIRKISASGVTTIAGGLSNKTGRADGPAQNATFSDDFQLVFVPAICALLIADRANHLVRQIDLKSEDCTRNSQSGLGAAVSYWITGMVISCLFGLVMGFAIRHYLILREGRCHLQFNKTWKHSLINRAKLVPTLCFDIRSAVVRSKAYALLRRLLRMSLSHILLVFRISTVDSQTPSRQSYSLLDADVNKCEVVKSSIYHDQLKDLIAFNGNLTISTTEIPNQEDNPVSSGVSRDNNRIDDMINANMKGFMETAEETNHSDVYMLKKMN